MNKKGKQVRRYSKCKRYSSEKRVLAVLLVALYVFQPVQGTLKACFQNIVQIMEVPEYVMGHESIRTQVAGAHRSTEHILLSDKDNELSSKLWKSLTDSDTEGPFTLPEPNNQQKHTGSFKEILLQRWVNHKSNFATRSMFARLVVLPVPDQPPQAS